uniref:Flavonoid 3'-monooxygenase n=1 Tax=Ananas comosus var. bracteatus TaxID=296719 RepID=A0A6V7Q4E7_ANACO|nr:unnamed protein product [Ananas comosus var. bracteatus]
MAAEGCEINGYCIPKQATLLVNILGHWSRPGYLARSTRIQPGPISPGGANESVDVKGNDFELIPFGAGRRICAGLSLGLRMVQLMTATLVHAFDWTLPDGQPPEKLDMEEAYGLTLQRAVPLVRSRGLRLPPGPKGWPILGNLPQLGPKPHHTLHALSKAHGPLFHLRFGFVDVVVASSAAVAAQFLKVHDANFSNRPPTPAPSTPPTTIRHN